MTRLVKGYDEIVSEHIVSLKGKGFSNYDLGHISRIFYSPLKSDVFAVPYEVIFELLRKENKSIEKFLTLYDNNVVKVYKPLNFNAVVSELKAFSKKIFVLDASVFLYGFHSYKNKNSKSTIKTISESDLVVMAENLYFQMKYLFDRLNKDSVNDSEKSINEVDILGFVNPYFDLMFYVNDGKLLSNVLKSLENESFGVVKDYFEVYHSRIRVYRSAVEDFFNSISN